MLREDAWLPGKELGTRWSGRGHLCSASQGRGEGRGVGAGKPASGPALLVTSSVTLRSHSRTSAFFHPPSRGWFSSVLPNLWVHCCWGREVTLDAQRQHRITRLVLVPAPPAGTVQGAERCRRGTRAWACPGGAPRAVPEPPLHLMILCSFSVFKPKCAPPSFQKMPDSGVIQG